jgi:hypothetical protein
MSGVLVCWAVDNSSLLHVDTTTWCERLLSASRTIFIRTGYLRLCLERQRV